MTLLIIISVCQPSTPIHLSVRHIGSSSSIGDPETAYLNRLLREKRAESASAQSLMTKQRHMAVDYSFASPFADFAAPVCLVASMFLLRFNQKAHSCPIFHVRRPWS